MHQRWCLYIISAGDGLLKIGGRPPPPQKVANPPPKTLLTLDMLHNSDRGREVSWRLQTSCNGRHKYWRFVHCCEHPPHPRGLRVRTTLGNTIVDTVAAAVASRHHCAMQQTSLDQFLLIYWREELQLAIGYEWWVQLVASDGSVDDCTTVGEDKREWQTNGAGGGWW
jgi:hypothetical protein